MAISSSSSSRPILEDAHIWQSLKHAIAASSGFQRWELEHPINEQFSDVTLEHRVNRYLRETLETLAY